MPRYNIVVKGRVQGVGFRYYVSGVAQQMKLTGWVRNLDNGNVELEVQSENDFLDELLNKLKHGNSFSKVTDFEIKNIADVFSEKKFKVTY